MILTLVLATGGLGFIGSHTCLNLIQNGFDVLIIDSLVNSSEETLLKIIKITQKNQIKLGTVFFQKGDIRDKKFIDSIFLEQIVE